MIHSIPYSSFPIMSTGFLHMCSRSFKSNLYGTVWSSMIDHRWIIDSVTVVDRGYDPCGHWPPNYFIMNSSRCRKVLSKTRFRSEKFLERSLVTEKQSRGHSQQIRKLVESSADWSLWVFLRLDRSRMSKGVIEIKLFV